MTMILARMTLDYLLKNKTEDPAAGREALEGEDGNVIDKGEFCG